MSVRLTRFVDDPIASDSAQFPLGRPVMVPDNTDRPSECAVRPWGLRAMARPVGKRVSSVRTWRYDHYRQIAVTPNGRPLKELHMDPSADSVSNNDGDEGPNEDWMHDFAPDVPGAPA